MPPETTESACLAQLEAHRGILHKVASTYCPRPEDRDDLVQEISLQVWRSYARYDGRCRFSTWLYRIALNVAISFHRKEHPHREALLADDAPLHRAAAPVATVQAEDLQVLHAFIATLDDFSKALVMLYLDDCSHQDIADVLGISPSNVSTKLGRIKERLRRAFTPA